MVNPIQCELVNTQKKGLITMFEQRCLIIKLLLESYDKKLMKARDTKKIPT